MCRGSIGIGSSEIHGHGDDARDAELDFLETGRGMHGHQAPVQGINNLL